MSRLRWEHWYHYHHMRNNMQRKMEEGTGGTAPRIFTATPCISQKREFPFCMKPCHFELTFQTKQEEKVNISIQQNFLNVGSELLTSP